MDKKTGPIKLTDILIRRNMVEPDVLRQTEQEALNSGVTIEKELLDKRLLSQEDLALAISEYLGIPPISLAHFTADAQVLERVPKEIMARHKLIPVAKIGKTLTVAMGDPFNIVAMDELHTLTDLAIVPLVASEPDIVNAIRRAMADRGAAVDLETLMKSPEVEMEVGAVEETEAESLEKMMESAGDQPVIRMVNMILIEAVRLGANDIHIEPQENFLRLRYRIDGVLVERPSLPKTLQSAVVSRVKILADIDIGEQRHPQDGRFRITTLNKSIDVRVSVLPTIFGGRVVMRLLDKNSLFPGLSYLNLDERALAAMNYAINQPHGIILVTGPTGSGKTTTLYSCLRELNKIDVNVVTCEEPVEYQIPGVIQVKITAASSASGAHGDHNAATAGKKTAGCTFGDALRAILRQDPDIVLIGEIRDGDTADIAIKAALTGHLVLSTIHANDACSTITRLLDMGIEPFLLASSIILTQAQRLYRKLCPICKKEAPMPEELLKLHHVDPALFQGCKIYGPSGCPKCHSIGYSGRAAVMEVLPIEEDIRLLMMRRAPADALRDRAAQKGMKTLSVSALEKVKLGETSFEAALKIVSSR
ncbi:MAG: ATPase, T2SS/T4P/T4SS family [Verrucomicrobiota bacterium]|nr:ATPase, T2SS/T4P/T4SS family [Verrucomicrobiota bacterium]